MDHTPGMLYRICGSIVIHIYFSLEKALNYVYSFKKINDEENTILTKYFLFKKLQNV